MQRGTITYPMEIRQSTTHVSANFTTKLGTSAYSNLDVVGASTDANIIFTNATLHSGRSIYIKNATLRIDDAAVISGMDVFRLHLFSSAPTELADNAAFAVIEADNAKWIGSFDFGTIADFGSYLYAHKENIDMLVPITATSLYGVLQTVTGWTPVGGHIVTITLNSIQY